MNKRKGAWAECLAEKYLRKRGYKIKYTNYFCRWGEIDIIAGHNGKIVFVEVKQRKNILHGSGLDAITPNKVRCLRNAIDYFFINEYKGYYKPFQFDVIEIIGQQKSANLQIQHYKNLTLE